MNYADALTMSFSDARIAVHDAAIEYIDTLAAYNAIRDGIARDLRGTKAALSEAQKDELKQRMESEHRTLCSVLYVAECNKLKAQLAFDLADNEAKNARREIDAATADKWMTISERLLEFARLQAAAIESNYEKAKELAESIDGITA